MEQYVMKGGNPLVGEVTISGAKNAALGILAASIMTDEDVIIENKQAIEMANIYSGILSGTMDAFASVISNNLNIVMKFLATITIVMSIPTMVASFYGMNVNTAGMPYAESLYGFWIVLGFAVVLSLLVALIFSKKDLL